MISANRAATSTSAPSKVTPDNGAKLWLKAKGSGRACTLPADDNFAFRTNVPLCLTQSLTAALLFTSATLGLQAGRPWQKTRLLDLFPPCTLTCHDVVPSAPRCIPLYARATLDSVLGLRANVTPPMPKCTGTSSQEALRRRPMQDPAALAQHSTVSVSLSAEIRWLTLCSRSQCTIGSTTQVKSSTTCAPVFLSGSLVYVMAVGDILAENVWQVIG